MGRTREEYREYLKSEEWAELRSEVRHERGNRCEFCGRPAGMVILHCHHMTYERFGGERKSDLLILCEFHHNFYHQQFPSALMPRLPDKELKPHVLEVLRKCPKQIRSSAPKNKKGKKDKRHNNPLFLVTPESQKKKADLLRKASDLGKRVSDHSAAIADLKRRQALKPMVDEETLKRRQEKAERKRLKKERRKRNRKFR